MRHLELTTRAQKDLVKLGSGSERTRILRFLRETLAADPWPKNLDIKELKGADPWQRVRVGEWRIVFRTATGKELAALKKSKKVKASQAVFVGRIVNRRDLERAITTLI